MRLARACARTHMVTCLYMCGVTPLCFWVERFTVLGRGQL